MNEKDLSLISHLMRRAGFGANREEIESYGSKTYEEIVDDLLNPERFPEYDTDMVSRYMQGTLTGASLGEAQAAWMLRMAYSPRPLEERMTLFWHHLFAAGWNKSEHVIVCTNQIETFRKYCLSDMRSILIELSKDPMMVEWLDNSENHRDTPNENYAREIMELFSMGVGNYSEHDIKEAARAFTGWTMTQPIPLYPFGFYSPQFEFRADDHDYGEKTFLGETGNFDGYDIVDIIVKQPATAKFIARHLYNFFVADEPQVPAWNIQPPGDPSAVDLLSKTFAESKGDLRQVLKVLFNSNFFKEARFKKIKSPVDLVVGTVKIAGTHKIPQPSTEGLAAATKLMGQALMDAPTVEGWHTGHEWVDSGTLTERINFATNHISDISSPGIQDIITRIKSNGPNISPQDFLDSCLNLMGPMEIDETTHSSLMVFANETGGLTFGDDESDGESADKIRQMLQLVVSCPEYQFA